MLPPISVIFWATAGMAGDTDPMTAAMPNAVTIATAATNILVFICGIS
jgi:hypothetical protein